VKKISALAIAAILALTVGAALPAPLSLYRIELEPGTDAYRFAAQHRMPVYHIGQCLLLSSAPADAASQAEIAGQNLVYSGDGRDLRWVHRRRGDSGLDGSVRPLFDDGGLALVKSADLAGSKTAGLVATVFPEQPIPLSLQATIVNPGLAYDPQINALAQQITIEHFQADVETLQAFNTRSTYAPNHEAVTDWIKAKFQSLGITDVAIDSFVDPGFQNYLQTYFGTTDTHKIRNVIAVIPGLLDTSVVYIAGGHFDTSVWPYNPWAPGADDNGSGTAAVFEMARVLSANPPNATVKIIAFDCEEWGLYGSKKDANDELAAGRNIGCMLNYDMIGSIGNDSVFVSKLYPGSEAYAQILGSSAGWYGRTGDTNLVAEYNSVYLNGSDSWRYYSNGFRAAYAEEYAFSPVYHQTNDSTSYMNMRYATSIARAGLGMIATLSWYPQPVAGLAARDVGDGSRAFASWQSNAATNIVGYRLLWGMASGAYTDSATVAGISDTITGLTADLPYYVGVKAIDASGRQSPFISEVSVTPRAAPAAPAGLAAAPITGGISMAWRSNQELDLDGYRLYRAVDDTSAYDSLNTALLVDTSFSDSPLSGAHRYYYKARAFDLDGNAGALSPKAYGRPLTLDQGVLVVDETFNATTGTMPRDTAQDQFYDYILAGYRHDQHEFGSAAERPVPSDLAPYSTVLWHADDYSQMMASGSAADLKNYLDWGGNLWISGWKAAANVRNNATYPASFPDTSFLYHYLKVGGVNLSGLTDTFMMASGELGYPGMAVDPAKVPVPSWAGAMRYIESYSPVTGGDVIYTADMLNNASPFEGLPCGVRHLGSSYKTAIFGFPMYFMDRDQARLAAQQVMADFGETGVASGPVSELSVQDLELLPCAPNPFSASTVIRYHLAQAGRASLRVYNVAGQAVRTLVGGPQSPGAHSARWDGRDDRGRAMPGGVYFARLATSQGSRAIKITMLK
jgi:hypothetical protein